MPFIFHGRLCATLCRDCTEPLFPATVRLYRVRDDQDVTELATAQPKDTARILDDEAVRAKEKHLFAETKTDEEGRYRFEFGDDYDGGAFELDVRFETVPGQGEARREPVQVSVTTLRPQWRQREEGSVWAWDYCLSARLWCRLRELFGVWVICGRVVYCGDDNQNAPVPNLRVFAFDRDWVQDDPLGSAVTDASGAFRIYYTASDFKPGTFLDVELFGGPDVYFRVEDAASGTVLLAEPPSRGRDSDRENVGPCFCVRLCIDPSTPPPPQTEPLPYFTRVGGYDFLTDIDVAGTGLTVSDGRAFYSTLRLNGVMARQFKYNPANAAEAPGALEYKFQVRDLDASGAWTDVDPGSQVAATRIGDIQTFVPADPVPVQHTPVFAGDANAPIVGGWIRVPQQNNVLTTGLFVPNGDQIRLDSTTLAGSTGDVDLGGLASGDSVAAHLSGSGQTAPQNRHYALRMMIRKQGESGAGIEAGRLDRIAVNNHHYDNIDSHPAWVSNVRSNQLGVAMVNIAQLAGAGCAGITTALDILVTASHPTLGSVSVTMTGPGGPYAFTAPAASGDERAGTATPPSGFDPADLDACAYIVTLSVQLLLTTGDSAPDNLVDQIAFCKS